MHKDQNEFNSIESGDRVDGAATTSYGGHSDCDGRMRQHIHLR